MKMHYAFALFAALRLAAQAATPEQERLFVESYRKAAESKDTKALAAFLHTEGVTPEVVEFFTTLQAMDAGKKIARIELVTPTAEELADYQKPMSMPDGRIYKMPSAPTRQLVLEIDETNNEQIRRSSSKIAVGERNGKLVILLPVPAN